MHHTKFCDFDIYCKLCKYRDLPESQHPCDECLGVPARDFSHIPVNFVDGRQKRSDRRNGKKNHESAC